MIQESLELYFRRLLDFLLYTKNYIIRTNPIKTLSESVVESIKDFLTVKKKLKMAQYRLNYHRHQLQKMEQLIAENSDHSFLKGSIQLLLITKAIATAGKSTNELMQVGTDYESDSIIAKRLQERQYKLKLMEESLSLQKEEIQTRLQEIDTELKSVDEMIRGEIQDLFSYGNH